LWLDFSRASTPGRRAELLSRARREGIGVLFYDGDEGPGEAAPLSAQLGVRLLPLYAGEVRERSYFDTMEENLRSLREGLSCPGR
jgi:ABC-type Zn uptake system ZnuABC Zn-binding protein ZnuA